MLHQLSLSLAVSSVGTTPQSESAWLYAWHLCHNNILPWTIKFMCGFGFVLIFFFITLLRTFCYESFFPIHNMILSTCEVITLHFLWTYCRFCAINYRVTLSVATIKTFLLWNKYLFNVLPYPIYKKSALWLLP